MARKALFMSRSSWIAAPRPRRGASHSSGNAPPCPAEGLSRAALRGDNRRMDARIALLLDFADAEFDGETLNGPSFMKTLESLGPDAAAWRDTHEGYSAWEVALHVAYFKHVVYRALVASPDPYPLPKGPSGFARPAEPTVEAWKETLAAIRDLHRKTMAAARAAAPSFLDEEMPKWGISRLKAIVWLCSHDTYHGAQLRNMGVPGLKEPREG